VNRPAGAAPTVSVTGGRAGTGELTWGQRAILRIMLMLGEDVYKINVGAWAALPEDTGLDVAVERITEVTRHYDTLRTRFVETGDDWIQVVDGDGDVSVDVVEIGAADLAAAAGDLQRRMRATRFKISEEWPVRFAVLTEAGQPRAVVWVSSHIVVDLRGMWALTALLSRPGGPLPDGVQPLEQALQEKQATDTPSMTYWREQIELSPPDPFPCCREPHQGSRFWYAEFESPALAAALAKIAVRLRTTTSSVLFAAVAGELARLSGADRITMNVVAANRYSAATRAALGTFSQLVPATVHVGGVSWPELVRLAGVGTIAALRRGAYDPRSLDALKQELRRTDPRAGDFTLTFNDIRRFGTPGPQAADVDADAEQRGEVRWEEPNDEGDSTIFLWIWDDPEPLGIRLMIDTLRISPEQGERLLIGIEERVLREARAG
jgi:hypothetical protein